MSGYYNHYWTTTEFRGDDLPYKWPTVKQYIPQEKNVKILDFGCGHGKVMGLMKKINPSSKYTGIDVSEKIISKNKKKFPDTRFYTVQDGEKLPFKDNEFDFIITCDVIEHIYNTDLAFKELSRVLKPQGKIVITTPYFGLLKSLIIVFTSFDEIFDPRGAHIRFFTKKSLDSILKNVKLKPITYKYFGRFYPLSRGIMVLAEK